HAVPALHVADSGTVRRRVVEPLKALEGAVLLEHRVEVPDEQHLRPAAGPLAAGDEMPGAPPGGAFHPLGPEAQGFEGGREQAPDLAHTGQVQGPAVDVDGALEQ